MKNNLAMIVSLINLQKSRVADAACRDSLEQLENRVRSISLVHDMLYLGGESARLDMRRYIEELCARVFESLTGGGPGIVLEIRIERVIADLDISIPIGLIITELMTNAVKYAFPAGRGGTIAVSFSPDASRGYVLTVADDGVGMSPGSEGSDPDGLGLRLVRALADQIGGTVAIESAAGTRISVAFGGETG